MKECTDHTPPWFVGRWQDWHRGHGCDKDDGKPQSASAATEIAQHAANADTGYLTDAELAFLRVSTTSGNTVLVRALDELRARREADALRGMLRAAKTAKDDHSTYVVKHLDKLLGFCVCVHCAKLPEHATTKDAPR